MVEEFKTPPAVKESGTKAIPIEEHTLVAQEFPEVEAGTFEPDYSMTESRSENRNITALPTPQIST